MKIITLFAAAFLITFSTVFSKPSGDLFTYMDPMPDAKYIKKETSIILVPSDAVEKNLLLEKNAFEIRGTKSGLHEYNLLNISDRQTLILMPLAPFTIGEIVTVKVKNGVQAKKSGKPEAFSFSFSISGCEFPPDPLLGLANELSENELNELRGMDQPGTDDTEAFPEITVTQSNNPSPGFLLLSNLVYNVQIPNTPYLLILKNDGTPVFSRQMGGQIFNFDRQPNGNFTYFSRTRNKYYELDTNYVLKDSFYTGNGYVTDLHELRVLPNRHALLMSYDKQYVNMSLYITGGNPNALVTGLIIQEIDENKNVVFQWRSWDHFEILDATHENLLGSEIDYVHGNAIEKDTDGNLLISSRHMDEITKISRTSGEIIWRLGGKKNQFTFVNDPLRFSYQHTIRRIANGNVTLHDNGNFHSPRFSRAIEYQLDEVNKTATLVWQYRNTPDYYGSSMGSTQRLSGGNTLICWGSTNPTLTEVKPDGSKALEITFATGVFSYRVFKYEFGQGVTATGDPFSEVPESYKLFQNYPNPFNPGTKVKFDIMSNVKGQMSNVKITVFDVLGKEVSVLVDEYLQPGTYEIDFDSRNLPSGVYYYTLKAGNYTETRKMVLIK
jgi:Arylsulfotransferase (ASST)/Secretion system C-terminal sorting domain